MLPAIPAPPAVVTLAERHLARAGSRYWLDTMRKRSRRLAALVIHVEYPQESPSLVPGSAQAEASRHCHVDKQLRNVDSLEIN